MVTALNRHSGAVRYRWTSRFDAVPAAVAQGWPVPMLLGKVIPRHWVLLIGAEGGRYRIYDPGHGDVLLAGAGELRGGWVSRRFSATWCRSSSGHARG